MKETRDLKTCADIQSALGDSINTLDEKSVTLVIESEWMVTVVMPRRARRIWNNGLGDFSEFQFEVKSRLWIELLGKPYPPKYSFRDFLCGVTENCAKRVRHEIFSRRSKEIPSGDLATDLNIEDEASFIDERMVYIEKALKCISPRAHDILLHVISLPNQPISGDELNRALRMFGISKAAYYRHFNKFETLVKKLIQKEAHGE